MVTILSYLGCRLMQFNTEGKEKFSITAYITTKWMQINFCFTVAVYAPFSIHLIILLLLNTLMYILKDNYVQRIKRFCISFVITISIPSAITLWLYSILKSLSIDVETNPGPKRISEKTFPFCHWNLNSISSHDYAKMFLLKAYITTIHI